MAKNTSIYINPPIRAAIEGAASVSGRLGEICDRYAEINRWASVLDIFEDAEINAIMRSCKGVSFAPAKYIASIIFINFEQSLIDGFAKKWGINPTAVMDKLSSLSYLGNVALAENIETFWRGINKECAK